MRIFYFIFIYFSTFFAIASDAIYCEPGNVTDIQAQTTNVLIKLDNLGWKQLGNYNEPNLNTKLSLALTAQSSGKKLLMAFPLNSGITCDQHSHNWNISPTKIRISK